jgi:hypothetical protein
MVATLCDPCPNYLSQKGFSELTNFRMGSNRSGKRATLASDEHFPSFSLLYALGTADGL